MKWTSRIRKGKYGPVMLISDADGEILEVSPFSMALAQWPTNARLITTAPDYDAAARLANENASPLNADDLSEGIIISEAAYDALRAAIAKARSEGAR